MTSRLFGNGVLLFGFSRDRVPCLRLPASSSALLLMCRVVCEPDKVVHPHSDPRLHVVRGEVVHDGEMDQIDARTSNVARQATQYHVRLSVCEGNPGRSVRLNDVADASREQPHPCQRGIQQHDRGHAWDSSRRALRRSLREQWSYWSITFATLIVRTTQPIEPGQGWRASWSHLSGSGSASARMWQSSQDRGIIRPCLLAALHHSV